MNGRKPLEIWWDVRLAVVRTLLVLIYFYEINFVLWNYEYSFWYSAILSTELLHVIYLDIFSYFKQTVFLFISPERMIWWNATFPKNLVSGFSYSSHTTFLDYHRPSVWQLKFILVRTYSICIPFLMRCSFFRKK